MRYIVFDDFFAVLGNKQRVQILQYLNQTDAKSVGEICAALSLEQSSVSHNMRRLLDCHFVLVTPCGKERRYQINSDTIGPLFQLIDTHVSKYCANGCVHWDHEIKSSNRGYYAKI